MQIEKQRLAELNAQMRQVASRMGPLHSFWDVILDNEAALEDDFTLTSQSLSERINEAENYLNLTNSAMTIEDFEDQLIVNPPAVPGSKYEARCHLCSWSFHKWTDDDARTCLRTHIIDEHLANIEYRKFVSGTGPNTS